MSLIIATGSNLGNKLSNLNKAKELLSETFSFVKESRIYESKAILFTNQPDFFNQVLEFKNPKLNACEIMKKLLRIEEKMGRKRGIDKGPRIIDLDLLFLGFTEFSNDVVTVPHPSWKDRSFVVLPLLELPFASKLKEHYKFPDSFSNSATPLA